MDLNKTLKQYSLDLHLQLIRQDGRHIKCSLALKMATALSITDPEQEFDVVVAESRPQNVI